MADQKHGRGWLHLALAFVLTLGVAAALGLLVDMSAPAPASANSELHPGGRLFFPAWDVRNGRFNFLIITRLALPIVSTDTPSNCRPGHNTAFPNSTYNASGANHTTDEVHLEWYGKTCESASEILPMSCADVDLIFLSSGNLGTHASGLTDQQGSLDVHFIINGTEDSKQRVLENSLMGNGVVLDGVEGWAAAYPAASAKATFCSFCDVDNGTQVGYEAFATELFIPFALADTGSPAAGSTGLRNELYLWAPSFFPGGSMASFKVAWSWYDGRERRFQKDKQDHAIVDTLKNLDTRHKDTSFTCSTTSSADVAETDGSPKSNDNGTDASGGCAAEVGNDGTHPSDNDQTVARGYTSTAMSWWDISKITDDALNFTNTSIQAARGMVGVVLASVSTDSGAVYLTGPQAGDPVPIGNGDAIRLWHKDPCEIAPRGQVGPPHLRDLGFRSAPSYLVGFNIFPKSDQLLMCGGSAPTSPVAAAFNALVTGSFSAEIGP